MFISNPNPFYFPALPCCYIRQVGIQGNLDPMVLFAPKDVIKARTEEILRATKGTLITPQSNIIE